MKKISIIAAAATLTVAGFAYAGAYQAPAPTPAPATDRYYVGIGITYPAAITEESNNDKYNLGRIKLDEKNVGGNIFIGDQVSKYLAAELGFTYLGNMEYKNSDINYDSNDNWLIYLDGLVHIPLMNKYLCVFGKAGVNYYDHDADIKSSGNDRLKTFGINYGGGLQFTYMQFAARLTYTQLHFDYQQQDRFPLAPSSYIGLDLMYYFS